MTHTTSEPTEIDPDTSEPDPVNGPKLSHEDAIKELAKVRREAADHRTKRRELEQRLEGAKTPEEIEAILAQDRGASAAENRALLVENVAARAYLPAEVHDRLRGDTRAELEADAAALAALLGIDPSRGPREMRTAQAPRGGLDPTDDSEPFDPAAIARRVRRRH